MKNNHKNKTYSDDCVGPNKLLSPNIINISFNNYIHLQTTAYYDIYEANGGDGFYPLWAISNFTSDKNEYASYGSVFVSFTLILDEKSNDNKYIWKQYFINKYNITGFDSNSGDLLLQKLNEELNLQHPDKENGICIVDKYSNVLFSKS